MKKTALTLMLGGILLAGSAAAHEAGSVVVRVGAITVDANSSSRTQTAIDVGLKVKNNTQRFNRNLYVNGQYWYGIISCNAVLS